MKIKQVLAVSGVTGFFFDDQRAIKAGAISDGFTYQGGPVTPGFSAIRQRGESLSVMVELDDGCWVYGDCAAVQYSGAGGRDPLFLAEDYSQRVLPLLREFLVGRDLGCGFRQIMRDFYAWTHNSEFPKHQALAYGVSQAMLAAVAAANGETMA